MSLLATERAQFFWDSPILAGATIAAVIPWILSINIFFHKKPWIGIILINLMNGLLIFCCVLTQSRGPLLAVFLLLITGIFTTKTFNLPKSLALSNLFSVWILLLFVLLSSSADRIRVSPTEDGSIKNRLTIFKASLDMIVVDPIKGIGSGESGFFLANGINPRI